MCSTVFEGKQVWGAHLSLLGVELNPILIRTKDQSLHKAWNRSQIMTSSECTNCCCEVGERAARAPGTQPGFADVHTCAGLLLWRTTRVVLLCFLHLPTGSSSRPGRPRRSLLRMPHIPLAVLQTFHPHRSTL